MIKIRLWDWIGEKYGHEFSYSVGSIYEALQAINTNRRGFLYEYQKSQNNGVIYVYFINGKPTINEQTALNFSDVVDIVPMFPASFNIFKAIGRVIRGVVKVVTHVVRSAWKIVKNLFRDGTNETSKETTAVEEDENSGDKNAFGGSLKNSYSENMPVQLVYGRLKVGSIVFNKTLNTSLIIRKLPDSTNNSQLQQDYRNSIDARNETVNASKFNEISNDPKLLKDYDTLTAPILSKDLDTKTNGNAVTMKEFIAQQFNIVEDTRLEEERRQLTNSRRYKELEALKKRFPASQNDLPRRRAIHYEYDTVIYYGSGFETWWGYSGTPGLVNYIAYLDRTKETINVTERRVVEGSESYYSNLEAKVNEALSRFQSGNLPEREYQEAKKEIEKIREQYTNHCTNKLAHVPSIADEVRLINSVKPRYFRSPEEAERKRAEDRRRWERIDNKD